MTTIAAVAMTIEGIVETAAMIAASNEVVAEIAVEAMNEAEAGIGTGAAIVIMDTGE